MAKKVFITVEKRKMDRLKTTRACAYDKIRHLKYRLSLAQSENTMLKNKVRGQKAMIKRQKSDAKTQIGVLESTKKQALSLAKGYKYANGILEQKMKTAMKDSSKAFSTWRGWCHLIRKRWEGK